MICDFGGCFEIERRNARLPILEPNLESLNPEIFVFAKLRPSVGKLTASPINENRGRQIGWE